MILFSTSNALSISKDIPKKADKYIPLLHETTKNYFSTFPFPAYFGALIEHESCISLKHSKCWNPKSQLYVKGKEQGVGFGQITRTWRNGKIRFDTLSELKRKYPRALKHLNWGNIKSKPKLQMTAVVLKWRDTFKRMPNVSFLTKVAFTDAAYNGGYGGLRKDRKLCGLRKGCDPKKWFNNVEKTCSKSKKVLYGRRSACDINRHHVKDVLKTRASKYLDRWNKEFFDQKLLDKFMEVAN